MPLVWSSRRAATVNYQTLPIEWSDKQEAIEPTTPTSVHNGSVPVGNARVLVVPEQPGRSGMRVLNNGGSTAYLGDEQVSSINGYPLESGQEKAFLGQGAVYAVADVTTATEVRWIGEY